MIRGGDLSLSFLSNRNYLAYFIQESLQHVSASDPQCCTALKALNSCIEADAAEFCEELLRLLKVSFLIFFLRENSYRTV